MKLIMKKLSCEERMLKFMKKYLFALIFLSQISYAQELKLECDLIVETRYSEGGGKQQRTTATVDVEMSDAYKFIKIANHKIIAVVSSLKTSQAFTFADRSEAGKWDLMLTDFDARKNEKISTSIRIDRNTGKIFFNDRFEDSTGYTNTSGNGDCVKVDLNRRKF